MINAHQLSIHALIHRMTCYNNQFCAPPQVYSRKAAFLLISIYTNLLAPLLALLGRLLCFRFKPQPLLLTIIIPSSVNPKHMLQ